MKTDQSDTPRTDAAAKYIYGRVDEQWISLSFARTLERENTILREALEKFRGQFDSYECSGTAEDTLDSLGVLFCAYCNEPIKPGQPTVLDEWGDPGARMHIGCSAEDQDGQDLDRDVGHS